MKWIIIIIGIYITELGVFFSISLGVVWLFVAIAVRNLGRYLSLLPLVQRTTDQIGNRFFVEFCKVGDPSVNVNTNTHIRDQKRESTCTTSSSSHSLIIPGGHTYDIIWMTYRLHIGPSSYCHCLRTPLSQPQPDSRELHVRVQHSRECFCMAFARFFEKLAKGS